MLDQQLRVIPFFRDLPGTTLDAVAARLRLERYERGSLVFRRGDPSDALYLVQSGQVDVVLEGTEEPLAHLGPGSFVGEIGLLLDEPRSATLKVVSDCELWRLAREDLEALLLEHPQIAIDLSRELGRRLVATNLRIAAPAVTRYSAVWGQGATELAGALIELGTERVGLLTLPGAPPVHSPPEGLTALAPEKLEADDLAGYAGREIEGLGHLVLALPTERSYVAMAAVDLAEHVVAYRPSAADPFPSWLLRPGLAHRVLRYDGTPPSLRRAARWVAGRAVGLALSSGGSKCVAHLGVIRVLRELGVEIDAVAGTSGGGLAAAGLSCGFSDAELLRLARELARLTRFRRFDPNFPPRSALFKGVKIRQYFDHWMGKRSFSDTDIPLWVVATDVFSGEEVVIDRGLIADGLRATMSIPGAFNPWPYVGHLCMDGAVVNPLPASVLRNAGIRFVIGSSVAGQEILTEGPGAGRAPHLLQIVSRIMNSTERELVKVQSPLVDIMIRPDVRAANTFDFSRSDEFIATGVQAARDQAAELRQAVPVLH